MFPFVVYMILHVATNVNREILTFQKTLFVVQCRYTINKRGEKKMRENQEMKNAVIRLRVTQQLKTDFQAKCKEYSINASDLLRTWIEKYTYETNTEKTK